MAVGLPALLVVISVNGKSEHGSVQSLPVGLGRAQDFVVVRTRAVVWIWGLELLLAV